MRSRAPASLVLLAVALTTTIAACTPGDDGDVFATPTPDETPTPPEVSCQVVWTSLTANTAGHLDVFVLEAPEAAWTIAGTGTFDAFTAWYQPAVPFDATDPVMPPAFDARGAIVASSETLAYTLSLNVTHDGATVEIDDPGANRLYKLGAGGDPTASDFGSNDVLTFTGTWSDRTLEDGLSLGTGQARVLIGTAGDMTTLGDFGSYALCYARNDE